MKLGGREHAIRAFREWNAIVASGNDARFIGPRSFNFIFVMLSRVGMVDEAMLVRDSCFQNGYYLNRYSYNAFLNACAKSQRIDDAFDTLREMAETSVSPDVVSFNVLISCCVKSGDVDIALKILTRMRNWGIQPDVYSYNSVVNGLRKNQMLDEAFELVAQMERDAASPDPQSRKAIVETVAGVSPDLVTYNTLLSGLAGESCPDLERALRVKKHMEERGLHCNEVSYNALMAAAAKADRTEEAFDIYDEMISRSLKPNCECFTTLITLCGRAHMMDRAFEIHDHMMAAEIAPNVITFNALLTACRNSDADAGDSALKVLNVMHNTPGCDPDVITYSTVIDTLGRNGRFEELKEILTEMKERGIGPNLVTYTSMIAALTRAGDLDRALQLLDDMDRDGVAPNVYTFSSLINGAGRRGEFGKALEILDMMRGRGILPNRITYTMLLQLAGRGGRRELLERVLSEIEGDERMDETSIAKVREHCANGNIFHGGRSRMVVKEIAEIISKRLEKRSSRSQQGDSMR